MSKETYMCTLNESDEFGFGTDLVVRMDFNHGPTDFSVLDEYPFQKMAGGAGVPVPTVVYCEADESHMGQPFVVMQRCPGVPSTPLDYNLTNWADNAEDKRKIALQIAENLGKFHAISVPENQLKDFDFKEYVKSWYGKWQEFNFKDDPAVHLAFNWLIENTPGNIAKPTYVHGDHAPGNMLCENGKITTLLDWEFVHVGDPSEDLNYVRPYLDQHIDWNDFLAEYQRHGGADYDDSSTKFYLVWSDLRNLVCVSQAFYNYCQRKNSDLKLPFQYFIYVDFFAMSALETIKSDFQEA